MTISSSMLSSYYTSNSIFSNTTVTNTNTSSSSTLGAQQPPPPPPPPSSSSSSSVLDQLGTASSSSTNTSSYTGWEEYVSIVEPNEEQDYYEVSYVDSDGNEQTEQIYLDDIDGHSTSFAELAVLSSAGYISEDIGELLASKFTDENGEIDYTKSVDALQTVGDTIRDSINGGDYATAMKYTAEGKLFNDFAQGTDENDPMTHYMRLSNYSMYNPNILDLLSS